MLTCNYVNIRNTRCDIIDNEIINICRVLYCVHCPECAFFTGNPSDWMGLSVKGTEIPVYSDGSLRISLPKCGWNVGKFSEYFRLR